MTPRPRFVLAVLATVALATSTWSQVFHVPGDFDDLQVALDSVPEGATVRTGGTWNAIVIRKPVTLVGGTYVGGYDLGQVTPLIALQGSGHGRVVLTDIHAEKQAAGSFQIWGLAPGIQGGGFDELHVLDSVVRAPSFCAYGGQGGALPCQLNGSMYPGQSALSIEGVLPLVFLERCTLEGSRSEGYDPSFPLPGPAAVRAPNSTVVVLDSSLQGGACGAFDLPVPATCSDFAGLGSGGPGIVAQSLYHAGSTFTGGAGGTLSGLLDDGSPGPCPWTGPEGKPIESRTRAVALRADLVLDTPPTIGTSFTLRYHGSAPGVLYASLNLHAPRAAPLGAWFLGPTPALAGSVQPGPNTLAIPALSALVGKELALQAIAPLSGLTGPVASVLR